MTSWTASWRPLGQIRLDTRGEPWLAGRYGAPFVWREDGEGGADADAECFWMALMGEASVRTHTSSVGLLSSTDGLTWRLP